MSVGSYGICTGQMRYHDLRLSKEHGVHGFIDPWAFLGPRHKRLTSMIRPLSGETKESTHSLSVVFEDVGMI
jgi:hypothetical protein